MGLVCRHSEEDCVCGSYLVLVILLHVYEIHLSNSKVTASAWINDLRNQIEQTRILSTALDLSSWSCVGRRIMDASSNSTEEVNSSKCSASAIGECSEPLLLSSKNGMHGTVVQNMDLPVSSSVGELSSNIECSYADEMNPDANDSDDIMGMRPEDWMNEVELWQQLEHELYDRTEGEDEADMVEETRYEEAAMDEVTDIQSSSSSKVKEVHRFFPPGRIMHIITLTPNLAESENEVSPTSTSSDTSQPEPDETSIGIFLTSRSLYSKVRLSQTMISDHFMPVYRRQIERLIKELELEDDHRTPGVVL